jgi:hypothetical protein
VQIELGRLLELTRAGRQPDSDLTVAELLDEYLPVAGWDVSAEETNLGYIRRTIEPALGSKEVRKVRGPLLDNLYARLQKCGNLACAGQPSTEHRHVPDLRPDPLTVGWSGSRRLASSGRLSLAARSSRAMRCRRCPSLPASRHSSRGHGEVRRWRRARRKRWPHWMRSLLSLFRIVRPDAIGLADGG